MKVAGPSTGRLRCGTLRGIWTIFGSAPAGLSEMSLLGDALGGNIRSLVLIHSIRVVAVVVIVPQLLVAVTGATAASLRVGAERPPAGAADLLILLACGVAGYVIGRRSRLPNSILIVSLLASAAVHLGDVTRAAPPDGLLVVAQVTIGCVAGARFAGVVWREIRSTLLLGMA